MGGDATFAGTTYQAKVIAFIYVNMLAQTRLNWIAPYDDTPIGVSGETDGPGDDARIEFGERLHPIEVQAKHGLTAGAKLDEVIARIRSYSGTNESMRIVLAVDRGSSKTVTKEFAADLERIRSGRRDRLKTETTRILGTLGDASAILERLYVALVDVDRVQDAEMQIALDRIASVLENPEQATAAMRILISDAADICATKQHRTRTHLITLLSEAKIQVRPPRKDERWHRQLDFTKALLDTRHGVAALAALRQLKSVLGEQTVEAAVRVRLIQQTATAHLQLGQHVEAYDNARRALDIDPVHLRALSTAGYAAVSLGELSVAKQLADRAIAAHPVAPRSWGLQTTVAAAMGEALPNPPIGVGESAHYRLVLTQLASDSCDWPRVLELTARLLAETPRDSVVLLFRANALLSDPPPTPLDARERQEAAERLATDVIDVLSDETHPFFLKALILRAAARRRLGRSADADADLARARELDSDDRNVIEQAARAKIEEGNEAAALALLLSPIVERTPSLLALRAQLRAYNGDADTARRELQLALDRLRSSDNANHVRLLAAEAALFLQDGSLAERILGGVTEDEQNSAGYLVMAARLAFLQGHRDIAEERYRDATRQDPAHRPIFLAELGANLLKRGDAAAAARVLNEVGVESMPAPAFRTYGSALMESGDLVRAQQLVDAIAARGLLPDWALSLATNIALRQEDSDAALRNLEQLVARQGNNAQARVVLTQLLLESGRRADADRQLNTLWENPKLTPLERMQTAHFLLQLGRSKEALATAFRAFRNAPSDPQIHRGFIGLVLLRNEPPETCREVGADTHVRLRSTDGDLLERTVFSDPPFDVRLGEFSMDDARAAGLLGKRVGDTIVTGRSGLNEKRWVVEQIVPAVVHAVLDAMASYERNFPRENFFMTGFSMGDLTSVSDLAPIISSVHAKEAHVKAVQELYRAKLFPLGFIAKLLGGTIAEVMQHAAAVKSEFGPLAVEWVDSPGQELSRLTAVKANKAVLTRSALYTAYELDLLSQLSALSIVAPRSLLQELRDEVQEATRLMKEGSSVMLASERGLTMQRLESGSPILAARLTAVSAQLAWVESRTRIQPRPLATIHPIGSREEELRDRLGHSSADAIALARHLACALYADDLGLRRLFQEVGGTASFSTVALLPALAERGALRQNERDHLLLKLITRGYADIYPTADLLLEGLRRAGELGWGDVVRTFALLGNPKLRAADAARLSAQVMKRLVMAPIQIIALERVVELALIGMKATWPVPLCAQLLTNAAEDEFMLLPQHLDIVRTVCRRLSPTVRSS